MKSKFPLLALSALFASYSYAFDETDWIIELWKSDDLNSWSILPLDAETLQDGRLRVQDGGDSRFYRIHLRTAEDVAKEKILAYIGAEGINVPVPTKQDYLDLAVGQVNPGDLAALNSHLLEFQGTPGELPAFIEAKIEMLSLRDPAALAYASTVMLGESETERLSGFLVDVAAAGVELSWLVLGRSEFKARDGSSYRSVIGPDGTVSGTVIDAETGMVFDGSSRVDFPNPHKTAALDNLYVMCHAGSDEAVLSGSAKTVVSAYAGTNDRGFDMGYVAAAGIGPSTNAFVMSQSPDNLSFVARSSVLHQHVPGVKKFSGIVFSGTNPEAIITRNMGDVNANTTIVVKDLWTMNPVNSHTTIYNNGNTWSVGSRPDGSSPFTGEADMVVAGTHPLTEAQRAIIHGAALKHGLVQTSKPLMMIFIGDSMTDGQTASVPIVSTRTHQIAQLLDSDWKGGIYTQIAQGGQPVTIQEGFWERAKQRFGNYPETIDKTVFFWGGYNSQAFDFTTPEGRAELIERYITMGTQAVALGIRPVHWSLTVSSNATAPEVTQRNLFSDEYAARCAAENQIFYDHRLTFDQGEFDATTRNEAYFVDTVHLSALGQQTLCKDFVARFPGPDIDLDADATNYIARITQKGANPTTTQKLAINNWYVDQKAAGIYPSLKLVYLPVWDVADANRVNMITGQMEAIVVPDVIDGAGFVQGNSAGVEGYFNLARTPAQIGMLVTSSYLSALILDTPANAYEFIGARNTGSAQHYLYRNAGGNLQAGSGATTVFGSTAVAGILSASMTPTEFFLGIRTSAGRVKAGSNTTILVGTATTREIYAMARNYEGAAIGQSGVRFGFWVAGLGMTDAVETAHTLAMKNLWEGVTGLAIP